MKKKRTYTQAQNRSGERRYLLDILMLNSLLIYYIRFSILYCVFCAALPDISCVLFHFFDCFPSLTHTHTHAHIRIHTLFFRLLLHLASAYTFHTHTHSAPPARDEEKLPYVAAFCRQFSLALCSKSIRHT